MPYTSEIEERIRRLSTRLTELAYQMQTAAGGIGALAQGVALLGTAGNLDRGHPISLCPGTYFGDICTLTCAYYGITGLTLTWDASLSLWVGCQDVTWAGNTFCAGGTFGLQWALSPGMLLTYTYQTNGDDYCPVAGKCPIVSPTITTNGQFISSSCSTKTFNFIFAAYTVVPLMTAEAVTVQF